MEFQYISRFAISSLLLFQAKDERRALKLATQNIGYVCCHVNQPRSAVQSACKAQGFVQWKWTLQVGSPNKQAFWPLAINNLDQTKVRPYNWFDITPFDLISGPRCILNVASGRIVLSETLKNMFAVISARFIVHCRPFLLAAVKSNENWPYKQSVLTRGHFDILSWDLVKIGLATWLTLYPWTL